jgi:Ribosome 60S biogenesis N-terminal
VLRRPLVEDAPPTALAVLQLLQEHVVANRRLPRHARAAFFGGSALDALRKAACDAPAAAARSAALALLTTLLCDVEVSPFLSSADAATAASTTAPATTAAGATAASSTAGAAAVPKSVLRVLLQLPAHSDAALQSVLFSALQATPALVAPYLRGLTSAALEPKPGLKTLQMYSMLTELLRTAPLSVSGDAKEGSSTVLPPEALLAMVLPPALSKKELTKVRLLLMLLMLHTHMNVCV